MYNYDFSEPFTADSFEMEEIRDAVKEVFDGITDEDSFQEADTGVLLYYANQIMFALDKVLGIACDVNTNHDYINGYREGVEDTIKKLKQFVKDNEFIPYGYAQRDPDYPHK